MFGNRYSELMEQVKMFFHKTTEINTRFFILLNNVLIYDKQNTNLLIEGNFYSPFSTPSLKTATVWRSLPVNS